MIIWKDDALIEVDTNCYCFFSRIPDIVDIVVQKGIIGDFDDILCKEIGDMSSDVADV